MLSMTVEQSPVEERSDRPSAYISAERAIDGTQAKCCESKKEKFYAAHGAAHCLALHQTINNFATPYSR